MSPVAGVFEAHKIAPSIPAWLICDRAFLGKYGLGVIYPGHRNPGKFVESGYLVSAYTVEELAGKITADPAQLRNTIARYNGFTATVSISTSVRVKPSSTVSTATQGTNPIRASGR